MTKAEMLAEAIEARHRLLKGDLEAEIRTADGESVKYAAADVTRLDSYIAELEAAVTPSRRPRSIPVFY
ncbi:gpW family head-tail joining protein [Parvibaculum sp.]|uniref:gpW family head-tail joining protein n=1 Tax=Parvibaculum sp. TaxID=2024848 RepID=UPI000C4C67B7|nr:gpW family head-tail joining protein [Parvibaculum sp.]MAM95687.1 hypothetical protein [Parvibaculum sp.]HCX68967.1 hypothetical protein [Rhodobiaceae bacterium]|tara:strand:- start:16034 stop:16240 length:207 start_codon:yes stop_codon:yes gene_type:complete